MKRMSFTYIIIACILWGTSGIFVHYMAPYGFSSLQMTFLRSIVSFISMGLYILIYDKKLFRVTLNELLLFALSGISFFGTSSCYYYSMQASSVSTAVVLMYTAPLFIIIYSVCFLGEKLTRLKTVAIACMLIGCCLVSGITDGMKFNIAGIVFGLLSGISYSAYNIFTKIAMRNKCNPFSATLYCFMFASLAGLIIGNPLGIPECVAKDTIITLPLTISLGICTCILPYFLYTLALKEIPAGTASALGITEPMSAMLFSVILLGESLNIFSICGIILILGSVFLLSKFDT